MQKAVFTSVSANLPQLCPCYIYRIEAIEFYRAARDCALAIVRKCFRPTQMGFKGQVTATPTVLDTQPIKQKINLQSALW